MIFKKYIFIVVLIIFVFDSYGIERTKLSGNTIFSKTINSAKNNDLYYDVLDLKELSSTNEALFDKDHDWIISFGASLAKDAYTGEVAVINGLASDLGIMGGIKLGSEFSLNKKFYIAPKVGIEADLMFISARVSLINYTDFKYYEPKITPEIGLSVLGYFNVTYGYNISLTSKRMDYVPTNRISITFNIPLSTHPAP